jgi:hypothetical protein
VKAVGTLHYNLLVDNGDGKKVRIIMKKLLTVLVISIFIGNVASAATQAFNIALNLFAAITITKVQNLTFPDQTITGSAFNVVVASTDAGAATFNATGSNNRNITRSVVEASINMSAPGVTGNIAVDSFTLSGPTAFNGSGNATGLKVGGTAHVLATSADGDYTGSATFRLVYQ